MITAQRAGGDAAVGGVTHGVEGGDGDGDRVVGGGSRAVVCIQGPHGQRPVNAATWARRRQQAVAGGAGMCGVYFIVCVSE